MPRSYYELLGRAVWTGGIWYAKRRLRPARHGGGGRVVAKRLGAGALVAIALGGAVVVAQRRGDHTS